LPKEVPEGRSGGGGPGERKKKKGRGGAALEKTMQGKNGTL